MTIEEYYNTLPGMITIRMDHSGEVVLVDAEWIKWLGDGRVEVTVPGHEGNGVVVPGVESN